MAERADPSSQDPSSNEANRAYPPPEDPPPNEMDREIARSRFYASERALRTWFMAYGVGAPALLISTEGALKTLTRSSCSIGAAILFALGILIQIGIEIWKKYAFRHTMLHGSGPKPRQQWTWISLDVVTIACFLGATLWVAGVFVRDN